MLVAGTAWCNINIKWAQHMVMWSVSRCVNSQVPGCDLFSPNIMHHLTATTAIPHLQLHIGGGGRGRGGSPVACSQWGASAGLRGLCSLRLWWGWRCTNVPVECMVGQHPCVVCYRCVIIICDCSATNRCRLLSGWVLLSYWKVLFRRLTNTALSFNRSRRQQLAQWGVNVW